MMFGQRLIQQIPALGIADEQIHPGFEAAGIIQTGSGDPNAATLCVFRAGQARAAIRAETAQIMAAGQAGRGVMFYFPLRDLESFERHHHHRRIRPAGDALAIAAVAIEHDQRPRSAFVADFAANTATGEGIFHADKIISPGEK